MKFKWLLGFSILSISFLSCGPDDKEDPILGNWEWSQGSRVILPSGFERLHRDRSETYLVGDAEYTYNFKADGTFESTYNTSEYIGTWIFEGDSLYLNFTQPENYTGLTEFKIPYIDEFNLDTQWTVQYLEFSDAQIEEYKNNGFVVSSGWTVDKDSLLLQEGIPITSVITLHFVKK